MLLISEENNLELMKYLPSEWRKIIGIKKPGKTRKEQKEKSMKYTRRNLFIDTDDIMMNNYYDIYKIKNFEDNDLADVLCIANAYLIEKNIEFNPGGFKNDND